MSAHGSVDETVFVTCGQTKRNVVHTTPACPRLSNAKKVLEKPASVFPEGYVDECQHCHPWPWQWEVSSDE